MESEFSSLDWMEYVTIVSDGGCAVDRPDRAGPGFRCYSPSPIAPSFPCGRTAVFGSPCLHALFLAGEATGAKKAVSVR